MIYVNLTAHTVNRFKNLDDFYFDEIVKSYLPKKSDYIATRQNADIWYPTGNIARCSTHEAKIPSPDDIPYIKITWGDIINLPKPEKDTIYIVSNVVATAAAKLGRNDCVMPARLVRNHAGQIIGCLVFAKLG